MGDISERKTVNNHAELAAFIAKKMNDAIAEAIERCAKIADEYECVGRSEDGSGIAALIRLQLEGRPDA